MSTLRFPAGVAILGNRQKIRIYDTFEGMTFGKDDKKWHSDDMTCHFTAGFLMNPADGITTLFSSYREGFGLSGGV